MIARRLLPVPLVWAALSAAPCMADTQVPSFERDIQPLFDENCVACHQTGSAQRGLTLEQGASYGALVGKASQESKLVLVKPGDTEGSYLLHKISGTQLQAGGSGARMPLGSQLDPASVELIRAWIKAGAPTK
ncbi:MAG: hypothetical protein JWR07_1765 [Nevskia sp.]|nr:hypothetical protein [Nevskia sp.]